MYIKHLSHSGFLIDDGLNTLIFDPISKLDPCEMGDNILFLISHSHQDHFKRDVLKDFYNYRNASFVFSDDATELISKDHIKNTIILENYQSKNINNIKVSAFGSTDKGNSYLVEFNQRKYFHSGDLNWWHWENKMSCDELAHEERIFKNEVHLLKDIDIDFAFVPVDPRLGENAYLAANYFIEAVSPKHIIPMHSFGEYSFYKSLDQHIDLKSTKLINVLDKNKIIFQK